MDQLTKTLEVLNDLIEVNGQRIWSYQAVLEGPADRADDELNRVFEQIIAQGQRLQEDLELEFVALAHDLPAKGKPSGTILRAWNVVKATFAKNGNSLSIYEFFNTGERALLKAYQYAERQEGLFPTARKLIVSQKAELSTFYRQYKQLYKGHQFA
ncbi:DUF2383 domain-containing protein [Parapedobacter sp. ISTM3]|uniref:DUF2383 domain-containing protein n=1 Tax=Parapedobacter luteus TaxID=623280 RepID=A0A1T5EU38_9SPHI|nr:MULTISPECIES: DUF2383 domain-containing protein [Parapedobacter]MBK1441574.1 DUF2383 domain-containing protein [Parapedobacter sp. ISTM3]SKB87473.1 protein of unknown function [Parapedobacter luteus]